MDKMAGEMDDRLAKLEKKGQERCAPKLNPKRTKSIGCHSQAHSKPKLADEAQGCYNDI